MSRLDDVKERRNSVETSGDLSEKDKKNVLLFLDQAIRFRELEVQLARRAEEFTRMVTTAPTRIKEIEAKLERAPPEEKSREVMTQALPPSLSRQQPTSRSGSTTHFARRL